VRKIIFPPAHCPQFAGSLRKYDIHLKAIKSNEHKPIAIWLGVGAGMLIIQIVLGGVTRLTGSGLSITQWDPILGVLPPLNDAAWKKSFELYQHIAQFKKVNSYFTLADYKSIFFWEWLHREWARLMGIVFLLPFIIFLFRRMVSKELKRPLALLFILGALQGAVGWLMVKTGLNDTDISVSHISLAVHFIFALLLLSYVFWLFLDLTVKHHRTQVSATGRRLNIFLLALLFIQLVYGAFMAGTHAALYAPTWPDINGSFLPAAGSDHLIHDLFYAPLFIQFVHRCMAYIITVVLIAWYFSVRKVKRGTLLHRRRILPLTLVLLQMALGIAALLNSGTPHALYFSIVHQFVGITLLLSLVATLYLGRTALSVRKVKTSQLPFFHRR
jgi:cytochrome c oxidase assembly protein subunit 15